MEASMRSAKMLAGITVAVERELRTSCFIHLFT